MWNGVVINAKECVFQYDQSLGVYGKSYINFIAIIIMTLLYVYVYIDYLISSGHRYKEHKQQFPNEKNSTKQNDKDTNSDSDNAPPKFVCGVNKCQCKHFYYIVAEGAWILRCRCKHKHIDHSCAQSPYPCMKQNCSCQVFDR